MKAIPWEIPSLEPPYSPFAQEDFRTMLVLLCASEIVKVMCRADSLSHGGVAGLAPGPHVWSIRLGVFCPSLLGSECKSQGMDSL